MSPSLNILEEQEIQALELGPQDVNDMIRRASDIVAPVWPIKNFVAHNPLSGLEDLPFDLAVSKAESYAIISESLSGMHELVNRELIKWCGAFLDEGQATISMPNKHLGFYRTFADLARYDRNLCINPGAYNWLKSLPKNPEDAVILSLNRLKVAPWDREEYIRQAFASLPGWSGYVKWRTDWQDETDGLTNPISLLDYTAVRLAIDSTLTKDAAPALPTATVSRNYIARIENSERRYRNSLLSDLMSQSYTADSPTTRPDAQLVFCIDVRSEPMRRSIEALGNYQTLGFAGFFGLPVRVRTYDEDGPHASCPVLVKPCHDVSEQPSEPDDPSVHRHEKGRRLLKSPKSFYHGLKYNFATPFALVEMLGPWSGLRMLARTFFPSSLAKSLNLAKQYVTPNVTTLPEIDDIPFVAQASYGENALRAMGLTENFAPLVVFCGHGSSTANNPYAAALDCGACGGNHGGMNARVLAAILNSAEIRAYLCERGLPIPVDTLFLAAEHNTTTDHVEILDEVAGTHSNALINLQRDLVEAADNNRIARFATFDSSYRNNQQAHKAVYNRSVNWSEVRPEWGLARNAAFIVGPRQLTCNVNLEGRSFLHSYDWKADTDGSVLLAILTAPMVVAQWINCQYLFSTLNNTVWGSGSKVTQNVTGKLGVMQGNASDLMHGLPKQSVFAADNVAYHEPMRLLTVVYAPQQRVMEVIERSPVLQKLFFNGWVNLAVIDPVASCVQVLQRDSTWAKFK